MNKGGRPKKQPTEEQIEEVRVLSKYGVPQETIALALGICENTLKKYCLPNLHEGRAQGDCMIAETQFKRAVVDGDVGMLKWLGANRMGQSDKQALEHSGPNGQPIQTITRRVVDG